MGHELHKDQHPPTSLQHKHSSQFIDHITVAPDVKIIFTSANFSLCFSVSWVLERAALEVVEEVAESRGTRARR